MVKQIIEAFPKVKRIAEPDADGSARLNVAECFFDTIQGENFTGVPSAFLRLQGCTLKCQWCDTGEVWRQGNPYSVNELVAMFKKAGLIDRLNNGHHLVLTGGSPLAQQQGLVELLEKLKRECHESPFVEVENECVLFPLPELECFVDVWNNSPKLANSGVPLPLRYKIDVIQHMAALPNAWFKFVVSSEADWQEIERDFLVPHLIEKHQVVLMAEGMTREELQGKYETVVNLACEHGVRMTDRLHVTIWNKKTGV